MTTWSQERMKRQMESLQERVSGAPSDIGDIRLGCLYNRKQAFKPASLWILVIVCGNILSCNWRDRMEDLERDVSKKVKFQSWGPINHKDDLSSSRRWPTYIQVSGVGGGASSGDVESMRKDLDKILGRDEHGTAQVVWWSQFGWRWWQGPCGWWCSSRPWWPSWWW